MVNRSKRLQPRRPANSEIAQRAASGVPATTGATSPSARESDPASPWRAQLDATEASGKLDPRQKGALLAFLDRRAGEVGVRLQGMQAEFYARKQRFGDEVAMEWLRDAKRKLKREQIESAGSVIPDQGTASAASQATQPPTLRAGLPAVPGRQRKRPGPTR